MSSRFLAKPDSGEGQTVQQPLARRVRSTSPFLVIRTVIHTTAPAHRTSAERWSSPSSTISRIRGRPPHPTEVVHRHAVDVAVAVPVDLVVLPGVIPNAGQARALAVRMVG
ncbi:hypothetical protein ACFXEL_33050 [Streptomyces sp. NPDC059382]|uniref:hypothetical protein n=1 Tax=Streptomyces sp. NPDC059382 TaxID=3346816 RepID=UPI0036A0F8FC